MFSKMFDLSVKRTPLQALGFYIVYFLIGILIAIFGLFASGMIGCLFNLEACTAEPVEYGHKIGLVAGFVIALLYDIVIASVLLSVKRLWTNAGALVLFLISMPLSIIGGIFIALIPITVLTTFESNCKAEAVSEESSVIEDRNENV